LKKKIERLITFEKEEFKENMEVTKEYLDYNKEYNEMFRNEN
jgi:hypothetical protein